MAIEFTYQRLSPEEFHRVTANQSTWEEFRGSGFQNVSLEEILDKVANPDSETESKLIAAFERLCGDPTRVEMLKDWHIIYYSLNGSAEMQEADRPGQPVHNVIFGGRATSVRTGYGSVRYFDHPAIGEIAAALEAVNRNQLAERLSPRKCED